MNACLQTHTSAGRLIKPERERERETPFYLEPLRWCHRRAKTYKNDQIKSISLNGVQSTCASGRENLPQSARPFSRCSCWLAAIDAEATFKDNPFSTASAVVSHFPFFENANMFPLKFSIKPPMLRFTRCPKYMHWLALALNKIYWKCSVPGWN